MSNTVATKESKDDQNIHSINKSEQDKSDKVEVLWLSPKDPDSEETMSDQSTTDNLNDKPQPSDDKHPGPSSASSWSAWGASAWSAWGKVETIAKETIENNKETIEKTRENITKTTSYTLNIAKEAAYSAAYSAGPEESDDSQQEKLEIDGDGNAKGLSNEPNPESGARKSEVEGSSTKDSQSGFSNSPSLASISSLTSKSVGGFFSGLTNYVEENKQWAQSMAADATAAIKENVKVPTMSDLQTMAIPVPEMLSQFNKEQQDFIKTKGDADSGVVTKPQEGLSPWIGYQEEEAMKAKILSLSADKRTFVRAPPSGVTFDFDYASVSSTALALLKEDPKLSEMRYELVPKVVKEDDFWKNYFYRVNLIKQSFDLKDFEDQSPSHDQQRDKKESVQSRLAPTGEELDDDNAASVHSHEADDDFISESYQGATKKEMAEVNESMRRLGLGGGGTANDDDAGVEEWEAELEGELNEFEVVSSKDGNEDPTDDMTETQIQEMLDAEDGRSSNDSLTKK